MISDQTPRVSYIGNASTVTPYTIPFDFRSSADIRVITRDEDDLEELSRSTPTSRSPTIR